MRNDIEFMDGFKVAMGDRVTFACANGTQGTGTVIGFGRGKVKIQPNADTVYGHGDRWALNPEAAVQAGFPDFNRLRDHGLSGGALVRA